MSQEHGREAWPMVGARNNSVAEIFTRAATRKISVAASAFTCGEQASKLRTCGREIFMASNLKV